MSLLGFKLAFFNGVKDFSKSTFLKVGIYTYIGEIFIQQDIYSLFTIFKL